MGPGVSTTPQKSLAFLLQNHNIRVLLKKAIASFRLLFVVKSPSSFVQFGWKFQRDLESQSYDSKYASHFITKTELSTHYIFDVFQS